MRAVRHAAAPVASLKELLPLAGAMNDPHDFGAVLDLPIEDQIVSYCEGSQVRTNIRPCYAYSRHFANPLAADMHLVKPTPGC